MARLREIVAVLLASCLLMTPSGALLLALRYSCVVGPRECRRSGAPVGTTIFAGDN